MQFEVIRKSHKKSIIVGVTIFIILAIVLVVKFTFAEYSLVKSIKIAQGTINYKIPDFKIMAMYKQKEESNCTEDSCYNEMAENEVMPESGYVINESKSYCELNGNKDNNAKIYTDDNGNHVVSKITRGSRCYIYLDKVLTAGETILGNVTVNSGTPDFSKTAQAECSNTYACETTNGVYKAKDNDGESYYFRGSVENNYVKFAGFYWRIIRINGDGSIRLIYDGTSAHANGTSTSESIAVTEVKWSHKDAYWNSSDDNTYMNNNAYVGLKYTIGELRGLGTKSNALQELEKWYTSNLSKYANKIDTNAGFCGDRTPSTSNTTSNGLGGTGTTETYYGASIRLFNSDSSANSSPVLTCENINDLYTISNSNKGNKSLTYPIGLITADEVSMAGGITTVRNSGYYLYNGQNYWTLSPRNFKYTSAYMFFVDDGGGNNGNHMHATLGLRPVINIRSDTKFIFTGTGDKGTITNPYIAS